MFEMIQANVDREISFSIQKLNEKLDKISTMYIFTSNDEIKLSGLLELSDNLLSLKTRSIVISFYDENNKSLKTFQVKEI